MTRTWKTVRIFISSTFRDMHAERDHLVRFVFPRLREELLKRLIHLVDVDLRWGVTSEQDALEVCREIIDECRPRFICIIGGRYGWMPPREEQSITAAEVQYAVLDRLDKKEYRYFYFRDPQVTASIQESAAQAGGYREFALPEEIVKFGREEAEALAKQRNEKLALLKQAIIDAGFDPFVYPAAWNDQEQRLVGLETFGERVYADLLDSINDELGTELVEATDEFAEENAAMEAFIEERVEGFVIGSRQSILDGIDKFTRADGKPNILILTGKPGLGKSALLGKFYQNYSNEHPEDTVIPHFIGASTGTTDLRRTLRRFCHELSRIADEQVEVSQDVRELVKQFPIILKQAADSRRVVLLIDALNQFDAADNAHSMYWLPDDLPINTRFIFSSVEHPILEVLRCRHEHIREIELQPLNTGDGQAIITKFLNHYNKRMSCEQVEALLEKPESGSPLYLLTALEELRTLGTYEEITDRIHSLPGEVRRLFLWILKNRLSQDPGFHNQDGKLIGSELVRTFVSLLGVSRHGLSHAELVELIAPGDPFGNVAALQRLLRPYLMCRGELLDFYHRHLREAVESEYLDEEQERLYAHRALAEYFRRKVDLLGDAKWTGNYPRGLGELPYHQTEGQLWQGLESVLTDLKFIEAKCSVGLAFDLVADYNRINIGLGQLEPLIVTAWEYEQEFGVRCPKCSAWAPIERTSLGSRINCETCSTSLLVNSFSIPAQWIRSPGRRHALREAGFLHQKSLALEEFGHFVSSEAHILNKCPELVTQQALNWPDKTFPQLAARARSGKNFAPRPWVRWINKPHRTSACILVLEGHRSLVTWCAFSPDGSRIASSSWDQTIKFWDAFTGELISTVVGHSDGILDAAFSPDGSQLVSASADGTMKLWEVATQRELHTITGHSDRVKACAFSPNGTLIASGSRDTTVRIWDASNGVELKVLAGHNGQVEACAFSPDGRQLITASSDETLRLWDVNTGEIIYTFHTSPQNKLAKLRRYQEEMKARNDNFWMKVRYDLATCDFSPCGKFVASGCQGGTVRVWDMVNHHSHLVFRAHETSVNCCRYSPDGKTLITASGDRTLRFWDPVSGQQLGSLSGHTNGVQASDFSPDGGKVVSCGDDQSVRIWDVDLAGQNEEAEQHRHAVTSGCFSLDGRFAVSASWDGTLRLWDGETGVAGPELHGHTDEVYDCTTSPNGLLIGSVSWDGRLNVWSRQGTCYIRKEICRVPEYLHSCPFSPDGSRIAGGGRDGTVQIWDVQTGKRLAILQGHRGSVDSVHWSPDGRQLLTESPDAVKLWNVLEGKEITCFRASTDYSPEALAHLPWRGGMNITRQVSPFSPDGKRVIIVKPKNVLAIFDIKTGDMVTRLAGHRGTITAFAFSHDATYVLSASEDQTLRSWDALSGKSLVILEDHQGSVDAIALSPDNKTIASTSEDKSLRVWDINSGKQIALFKCGSRINMIDWRSDGQALFTGDATGQIRLLRLESWEPGPPVATAWKAPDGILAVRCPYCEGYPFHTFPDEVIGHGWACPKSGRMLHINPFTINADWRQITRT